MNQGLSMIELLIGSTIISLCFVSLVLSSQLALKVSGESTQNIKAAFLMEEGMEAVRQIKDFGWANIASLTPETSYYLSFEGGKWVPSSNNIYIGGFERKFTVENVGRDANDDIVASGGVDDPKTKKINVYISWKSLAGTSTKSISAYLTDMF